MCLVDASIFDGCLLPIWHWGINDFGYQAPLLNKNEDFSLTCQLASSQAIKTQAAAKVMPVFSSESGKVRGQTPGNRRSRVKWIILAKRLPLMKSRLTQISETQDWRRGDFS